MRPIAVIAQEQQKEEQEFRACHTKHWDTEAKCLKFVMGDTNHTEYEQRKKKLGELNDELKAAQSAQKVQDEIELKARGGDQPAPDSGNGNSMKTLGELYTEGAEFLQAQAKGLETANFKGLVKGMTPARAVQLAALKTAYTHTTDATNAGFPPESRRTDIIVPSRRTKIFFQDMVVTTPWEQQLVIWMKQTLADNQAAVVAETGTKPQSTYKWEDTNVPQVVIAHWVKVTRQQLKYVPMIRTLIDEELTYGLRAVIQDKMFNGAGGNNDIHGILNEDDIQEQDCSGVQYLFDAIFMAMTKVRGEDPTVGGDEPDVIILNPGDLQTVKLTKDAIGNYLYGAPADEFVDRIWGKRAISTTSLTRGNGLVGDSSTVRHWQKEGINITTGYVNTDFIQNQQVILAEVELAQTITKPDSWCALTNIPTS